MSLIPADHIPQRDGAPECFEVMAIMDSPASTLFAFSTVMSPEELAEAKADAQRKLEAMATLGADIPAELVERLEAIGTDGEVQRACVGEPFELCWN